MNYEFDGMNTYYYHVVNYFLHALVSGLTVFCANLLTNNSDTGQSTNGIDENNRSSRSRNEYFIPVATGVLFAAHPIHTEAVSNITGRAELLMSFFYLTGLLIFAKTYDYCFCHHYHSINGRTGSKSWAEITKMGLLFFVPTVFMILSHLCKENGVLLLATSAVYDFMKANFAFNDLMRLRVGNNDDNDAKEIEKNNVSKNESTKTMKTEQGNIQSFTSKVMKHEFICKLHLQNFCRFCFNFVDNNMFPPLSWTK